MRMQAQGAPPRRLSDCSGERGVPGRLELLGELGASGGLDGTVGEHVDHVGMKLIEEPIEVRDRQNAESPLCGGELDTTGDRTECVDVKA